MSRITNCKDVFVGQLNTLGVSSSSGSVREAVDVVSFNFSVCLNILSVLRAGFENGVESMQIDTNLRGEVEMLRRDLINHHQILNVRCASVFLQIEDLGKQLGGDENG